MKKVFADTHYWIAMINRHDQWHDRVVEQSHQLAPIRIFTTDDVLVEVLNFFAGFSPFMRKNAVRAVWAILRSLEVETATVGQSGFEDGLRLYESRLDKGYSLTDCISMEIMRRQGIQDVLTHDKHFAQEGFAVLF